MFLLPVSGQPETQAENKVFPGRKGVPAICPRGCDLTLCLFGPSMGFSPSQGLLHFISQLWVSIIVPILYIKHPNDREACAPSVALCVPSQPAAPTWTGTLVGHLLDV